YRAAIVSSNEEEFVLAKQRLVEAIEQNKNIDDGFSFYSTSSLYTNHQIAFVYPGSGNHFFGMGQDLGVVFPDILVNLDKENEQLASQFAQGKFWQLDDGQHLSHEEVIFGQVWLGTFITDICKKFNIKPDAIIGYSLGETAGLFSTRTWTARDDMLSRIRNSQLFTKELAGSCTAVQEAWQTDEKIDWSLGVINASAEKVKQVIKLYSHVYLLIINTNSECVIGGDAQQVKHAVKKLNQSFHPLSGVTTVHCEVAKPVAKVYRDLHLFETNPPEGVTFYSGIRGGSYKVTRDAAADSILDQALAPFDYTKVINQAYEDGVRLFIEMGPGSSCTRMIDQILNKHEHVAKAICVKGQDSVFNLMQVLARLYVEGMPVDLSSIQNTKKQLQRDENTISVKVGGDPFDVPKPPISKNTYSPKKQVEGKLKQVEYPPVKLAANSDLSPLIQQMQQTEQARAEAQEMFLKVSQEMTETISQALNVQMNLLGQQSVTDISVKDETKHTVQNNMHAAQIDCVYDRQACMEFATGKISNMLGLNFSDIDQYPTRVRLPDEPLMLVDRIIELEGEANSLPSKLNASGRVVTEHDIKTGAWYLDHGRIPTCIAVESGQADLFLSGYLGIDHITKGNATYRLLDAQITFHGPLPKAGETIRYDIHIDHFFRQGDTWLFRFQFEGTVAGRPLLTMTHGCAGFFTRHELDAGKGIVLTKLEQQVLAGKLTGGYRPLLELKKETFSDEQLNALRHGDLQSCFGSTFQDTTLSNPAGLPSGRMTLVHRIIELNPDAGRYGLGQITGEADIQPDDWFLTCHFVDDQVMPGTLMYECCLHTLRVYLLRMGWIGEVDEFVYEPIIGEVSTLKCRGQVIDTTDKVQYEITLKEIGYRDDGTPYVLADALMYADHRPVVQMKNMSVQLTGLKKSKLESLWQDKKSKKANQVLFDNDSILAFAIGNPSAAFGDRYKVFDAERKIARLPGPPYKFLDRITKINNCEQWQLKAGGSIEAEYDVPPDEWYFIEDNQSFMPFSVLLEIALQPCGWLAAYLGSALTSDVDLSFRNLGGKATQILDVTPDTGTLTTSVTITNVSQSGGMIIQNFDYEMTSDKGLVYKGDTYFGFFSKQALADQIGIRDVEPYMPSKEEQQQAKVFTYPSMPPLPADMMRMVHDITLLNLTAGPKGKGIIQGTANVDADAWFFKAHFYQDPVWPGSLGLESFLQLLKVFAVEKWRDKLIEKHYRFESMALDQAHEWIYRGQILPTDEKVTIQAVINEIDDKDMTLYADGFLSVDGRLIYQMNDFALRIRTS
ncbi:MAG: type I polyketide synthase, partial [Pseudomonadota bacterium]